MGLFNALKEKLQKVVCKFASQKNAQQKNVVRACLLHRL